MQGMEGARRATNARRRGATIGDTSVSDAIGEAAANAAAGKRPRHR